MVVLGWEFLQRSKLKYMALQSSGQLSFSQIQTEFGSNTGKTLGNYRVSQNVGELSNLPLDTGIPQGNSEIKFSDFYGKKLNVVVDCHTGSDEFHKNAKNDKWNNNNVTVIGGFRSKKEGGSRIIIHVNKKFGSDTVNAQRCALRTGSWTGITALQVDVGSSGKCLGAGGGGGAGGTSSAGGSPGGTGTSGLGVEVNNTIVNVVSGGVLRAGFGGGGGGGGGRQVDKGEDRKASGAGGGGGQGFPGGPKGQPGGGGNNVVPANDNATAGDESEAGEGGTANQNASQAYGGNGGEGGQFGEAANAGANAQGGGGAGGGDGAAIRRTSGFTVTLNNSGTVQGNQTATGVQ